MAHRASLASQATGTQGSSGPLEEVTTLVDQMSMTVQQIEDAKQDIQNPINSEELPSSRRVGMVLRTDSTTGSSAYTTGSSPYDDDFEHE